MESRWLWVIVATALLLRAFVLANALRSPDPWLDPDDYTGQAVRLISPAYRHGLELNFSAFMKGPLVKAPLYPLVLSLFSLFGTSYYVTAAIMQILLATAS